MNERRGPGRALLLLVLAPLAAFPWMAASLLLFDALRGERLLAFHVKHDQRLLWDTFWSDYAAALPTLYLIVGGMTLILFAGARMSHRRARPATVLGAFGLTGWAAGYLLTGTVVGPANAALMLASLLTALPVAAALPQLTRTPTVQEADK